MKITSIIKIRPIRRVFDSDWDGVPNDMDCQWWNPHRQEEGKIGIKECINYLILNWGVPYTKAKELISKHRMPWKRDKSGMYILKKDMDLLGKTHGRKK